MKNNIKLLPLLAFFVALPAMSDVTLKDGSELIGKWKVYAESAKLDGEQKKIQVEWDFGSDGMLQTTATDAGGRTKEMKITIKYFVENGAIKKQSAPGREKYETCKVVEKDQSNMVLKCAYLYYFLTKL